MIEFIKLKEEILRLDKEAREMASAAVDIILEDPSIFDFLVIKSSLEPLLHQAILESLILTGKPDISEDKFMACVLLSKSTTLN